MRGASCPGDGEGVAEKPRPAAGFCTGADANRKNSGGRQRVWCHPGVQVRCLRVRQEFGTREKGRHQGRDVSLIMAERRAVGRMGGGTQKQWPRLRPPPSEGQRREGSQSECGDLRVSDRGEQRWCTDVQNCQDRSFAPLSDSPVAHGEAVPETWCLQVTLLSVHAPKPCVECFLHRKGGAGGDLEAVNTFVISVVVTLSQVAAYLQMHQIVCVKNVRFFWCK